MSISPDPSTGLSSERLRKAIERNRAKQARKSNLDTQSPSQGIPPRSPFASRNVSASAQGARSSSSPASSLSRPVGSRFGARQSSPEKRVDGLGTRRSSIGQKVNSEGRRAFTANTEVEFTEPPKRSIAKPPAKVTYTKAKIKKKKKKKTNPKSLNEWLVFFGWGFNFFLLIRLVFSTNGVIDYYSMEQTLGEVRERIENLKSENVSMASEIKKIKTNSSYQKKLAREHLGVIAKDEYLVLFAKDRK